MKKFLKNTLQLIGALLSLARGIMIIGMIFVSIITVYSIYTAYQITVNQYKESLTWKSTTYERPLAEIEPALTSNVVNADNVKAVEDLEVLEDYLNSLDGQSLDMTKAKELLDQAKYWQELYHSNDDEIDRLSLYIEIEEAIPNAYTTLDTSQLQELAKKLYNMELEGTTKSGEQYRKRLEKVSSDFKSAKNTMTKSVLSVGTLKNGVWTIPYKYNRTDLNSILEQIEAMQKFPSICNTEDILSDMATVLNHNKNAQDYFKYQAFMETVNKMSRSDYIVVSSVYTYEQALSYGLDVDVQNKPGFTISPKSPVSGIYYEGDRLDENAYIKKGTDVTVWIDEVYEEIQVIEPVIEPEPAPEPEPEPEPEITDEQEEEPEREEGIIDKEEESDSEEKSEEEESDSDEEDSDEEANESLFVEDTESN